MIVPPEWCLKYVDKVFEDHGRGPNAYDCWGLVREVLREQFNIMNLPDYGSEYRECHDQRSVANAVRKGLAEGWNVVNDPRAGDIVILNIGGLPWHCGVCVGGDWMMHIFRDANVVLERWTRDVWKKRVEGFYRHAGRN